MTVPAGALGDDRLERRLGWFRPCVHFYPLEVEDVTTVSGRTVTDRSDKKADKRDGDGSASLAMSSRTSSSSGAGDELDEPTFTFVKFGSTDGSRVALDHDRRFAARETAWESPARPEGGPGTWRWVGRWRCSGGRPGAAGPGRPERPAVAVAVAVAASVTVTLVAVRTLRYASAIRYHPLIRRLGWSA